MIIHWCGVFQNAENNSRYPPHYCYTGSFDGNDAKHCKKRITAFIKQMHLYGMKLVDQEVMDVED